MEDRNYREEIGKAIEEALELEDFDELEDLIEMPSPETFAKWVDMGQEKYEKRVRRKRLLTACAAVLVICLGAAVAVHYVNPPVTEAGPENNIEITEELDREIVYDTWEALPEDTKKSFIEIKNLPKDYKIEKIEVVGGSFGGKLNVYLRYMGEELCVRQSLGNEEQLPSSLVAGENTNKVLCGYDVYVEELKNMETLTYKFLYEEIIIDIRVPNGTEERIIEEIIKAVSQ